jgi:hypothetical protein
MYAEAPPVGKPAPCGAAPDRINQQFSSLIAASHPRGNGCPAARIGA